jgi:hypothetical protein
MNRVRARSIGEFGRHGDRAEPDVSREGVVMGRFTAPARSSRKSSVTTRDECQEMSERLRVLPARFVAVGEALVAETPVHAACAVVGRELARDGVDLGEALDGLRSTFALALGREPDFDSTEALSVAWSDETLGYLHQVSCENPLTGLATLAHLRARLAEVQRGAESNGSPAADTHALVVVDLPHDDLVGDHDHFGRALMMARIADRARLVFSGEESIGEASPTRLLVLTPRTDDLGLRVVVLRDLISGSTPLGGAVRVWIEGLPSTHAAVAALLDELART